MKQLKEMTYEERMTYTLEIHELTPAQAWAAWKAGQLSMYHMERWQLYHDHYFTPEGGKHE